MHRSSETLAPGSTLEGYDVCIAGAGAAGLPLARKLVGTRLRVLVLVAGSPDEKGLPPSFRQKIYGGEAGPFLEKVDPLFLRRSRLHMFGGTTNHFGFWSRPFDPADFRPRPGYRSASWPLPPAELEPWYREAMDYGRYGPFNFDDRKFWEDALFGRGFPEAAGDALKPAIFHAQYEERYHDFQLRTAEALEKAANVTLLFNASVLSLEADAAQTKVTALRCGSITGGKPGVEFRVKAARYVLALGGIETVRLLKNSGDLGNNRADHLGRGFMVHPLVTTAAEVKFSRPVDPAVRNYFRDQQIRLRHPEVPGGPYVHDTAPLVDPRLLFQHCVFNAWAVLAPTEAAMEAEGIGNFRLILRFNPQGDRAEVNINWEQVPNEESRITLGAGTDPVFGQPVTRLDWRLRPEDKKTAVRALTLAEAYLRRHGASDFRRTTDLSGGPDQWTFGRVDHALATGDHHMGALRMAASADEGIVDPNLRFHGVENLYAAGCGPFPTSGYANPTLTIVALTLRLADHLLH